jgi:radical SAM superfamily enzyme YgiQ (UPF0313 family)
MKRRTKILLVLPRDHTYQYRGAFSRSISYAPLTLTTLAALVPEELNASIDIVDEGVEQPNYRKRYDVVGITCVTSSSPRAYRLAEHFRNRGSFVVLGGAHPTLVPDDAVHHAHAVVVGAGEESWPRLLRDWRKGSWQSIYHHEPRRRLVTPTARRDLLTRGRYLNVPTVLASMGCGNRCNFCCINRLWGDHYRRDIDAVVEEIRQLGSRTALFLDPNLTYDKDYAKELFRRLIPLEIQWAGLASLDAAEDPELLDLMDRSGCAGILMGFESFNSHSLEETNKELNQVKRYPDIVQALHGRNIAVLGTFVLGLAHDTPKSIVRTLEGIERTALDGVRFSVLTPFPGTPLYDRYEAEGRILTKNWYYYDQEHVVFQPYMMHPWELQDALGQAWRQSYTLNTIARRLALTEHKRLLLAAVNFGFRRYAHRLATYGQEYRPRLMAMASQHSRLTLQPPRELTSLEATVA